MYGKPFLIRTDHGSLRWLMNFKSPEGQLARWLEILSAFSFEIQHRPGKNHGNADALSRKPCRQCGRCDDGEASLEPQQMVGESEVIQATVEEGDVHHSVIGQAAYEESSESEEVTRQCKETLVTAGGSDDSERGCSGPCVQTLSKVFCY